MAETTNKYETQGYRGTVDLGSSLLPAYDSVNQFYIPAARAQDICLGTETERLDTKLVEIDTAFDEVNNEIYVITKDEAGNQTSKSSRLSTLETDNTSNKNRISTLEDKYREATDTEVKNLFS